MDDAPVLDAGDVPVGVTEATGDRGAVIEVPCEGTWAAPWTGSECRRPAAAWACDCTILEVSRTSKLCVLGLRFRCAVEIAVARSRRCARGRVRSDGQERRGERSGKVFGENAR